jgi:hypothetical protein
LNVITAQDGGRCGGSEAERAAGASLTAASGPRSDGECDGNAEQPHGVRWYNEQSDEAAVPMTKIGLRQLHDALHQASNIKSRADHLAHYVITQAKAMTNGDKEFTDIIIRAVVRKLLMAGVEGEK